MSILSKISFFFLFLLWGSLSALAQKNETKWVFGYHAGVDFSSGNPVPFQSAIEGFGEGNASVCDSNGQLLFYTEGSFIWDRSNRLMANGSELTGLKSVTSYSVSSSTSQGTLIIPMPGNTNKYYVFSLTSMEQNGVANAGRLYYSIVDMTLNGGMGDVVPGQKGIFIDSALSERMTAVVGDRCNIWVVTCSMDGKIQAYEINFSVVTRKPVVSPVGMKQLFAGYLAISPNGKKLAATKCSVFGQGLDGAMLFDFDISTGLASNPVDLAPAYGAYGVCFSPDNSKLYVSAAFQHLLQYDVSSNNAATIKASETRIGNSTMTGLKRATNGKMYCKTSDNALGVINEPNLGGAACGYVENVIRLSPGTIAHSGLPNDVPTFTFSKDTIYTSSTLIDVCFNNSIPLYARDTKGWTYEWSDGAKGESHIVTKPGTYWVSYYTSPCSYNIDTFETFFPTVHTANSCEDQSNGRAWVVKALGDTNTYNYVWKDTAGNIVGTQDVLTNVAAGTYMLQVSSATGCNSKLTIAIEADIYKTSFLADTLVCQKETVEFKNTSDSYFTNHDWFFGDGGTSGAHSPSYAYASAGSFRVVLVGVGARCSDTSYHQIWVDGISGVNFTTDKDSVCAGIAIQFFAKPGMDSTIAGYKWSFGDETVVHNAEGAVQHAYDRTGAMPIQLTATFRACPDQVFRDTLYITAFPVVNLGTDSSICLDGKTIMLKDQNEENGGSHYKWSTGATDNAISVNDPGIYKLTVTSVQGCATTESVVVRKDCYVDVPNAFTPNGDGFNDYFFPRQLISSGVTGFSMQIFDRWGQKIFESYSINGYGWDGKFNGKDQPQGTYVYLIRVSVNGGRTEDHKGNVTIIR